MKYELRFSRPVDATSLTDTSLALKLMEDKEDKELNYIVSLAVPHTFMWTALLFDLEMLCLDDGGNILSKAQVWNIENDKLKDIVVRQDYSKMVSELKWYCDVGLEDF